MIPLPFTDEEKLDVVNREPAARLETTKTVKPGRYHTECWRQIEIFASIAKDYVDRVEALALGEVANTVVARTSAMRSLRGENARIGALTTEIEARLDRLAAMEANPLSSWTIKEAAE